MLRAVVILASIVFVAASARAQTPPFFTGGVVAYDPEISVTDSGNRLEPRVVTATPDLKHVHMGVGGGSVRVNDFHTFNFVIPDKPLGFVGGVNPTATATQNAKLSGEIPILNRRGMFLLAGP
ncbi:MAG TPA: hypothetical protein VL282_10100 [Tepidisphaeraceae bacterium]|jgi:hypothetical protein|nr:hypothetical protein [Tepidisphaeraceae bacterium]